MLSPVGSTKKKQLIQLEQPEIYDEFNTKIEVFKFQPGYKSINAFRAMNCDSRIAIPVFPCWLDTLSVWIESEKSCTI